MTLPLQITLLFISTICFSGPNDKTEGISSTPTTSASTTTNNPACNPPVNASTEKQVAELQNTVNLVPLKSKSQYAEYSAKKKDPTPLKFDKNSQACKAWVSAHQVCGEDELQAAKFLLDSLDFVPYLDFKMAMLKSLGEFSKQVKENPFVIVVDQGKSSEWLMAQFEQEFSGKKYEVVLSSNFPSYIKENKNINHVLRLDDAIYSGEQMERYSKFVATAASPSRTITLHLAVPYSTKAGKTRVLKTEGKHFKVIPYTQIIMKTIREKVESRYAKPLQRSHVLAALNQMYTKKPPQTDTPQAFKAESLSMLKHSVASSQGAFSPETLAHQFFEFKVPDGLSALEAFLISNEVRCKNGLPPPRLRSNPLLSSCIPSVLPPYKEPSSQPAEQKSPAL